MRIFNKIFCVGLWKTGTTSLATALRHLNINTLHNKSYYKQKRLLEQRKLLKPLVTMNGYRAFTDTPIEIDVWEKHYPNSLYIDTFRDLASWIRSVERHQKKYKREFRREKSISSWYRWRENIEKRFDKRKDYLKIDICNGEGWEKLSSFLETPIPEVSFPHQNKWCP